MRRTVIGFTLLELMITVAIVAIGAALAYPSFSSTFRSNRVASGTNTLIAAVNLARTEAIRSNRGAGVCPSITGSNCAGTNWNTGLLVYTDMDSNGSFSAGDTPVRFLEGNSGLSVVSAASSLSMNNRGRLNAAVSLTISPSKCPAGEAAVRTVTVTTMGQTRMAKGTCS